jgi:hypothetical protein
VCVCVCVCQRRGPGISDLQRRISQVSVIGSQSECDGISVLQKQKSADLRGSKTSMALDMHVHVSSSSRQKSADLRGSKTSMALDMHVHVSSSSRQKSADVRGSIDLQRRKEFSLIYLSDLQRRKGQFCYTKLNY